MRAPPAHTPGPPTILEQNIALAIVLWIILAGIGVVVANAWAMGVL
jgi:hypothetical protein